MAHPMVEEHMVVVVVAVVGRCPPIVLTTRISDKGEHLLVG